MLDIYHLLRLQHFEHLDTMLHQETEDSHPSHTIQKISMEELKKVLCISFVYNLFY